MLHILLDGAAHPATRLASAAGVASSTASEHLAVLLSSGLVTVTRVGRYRRYQLANAAAADALEAVRRLGVTGPPLRVLTSEQRRVRAARTCYDHLAGQLGVALLDALVAHQWIDLPARRVTPAGIEVLGAVGVNVPALEAGRRPMMLACLDWTERREHLAGALGAALTTIALERVWVRRLPGSRGLGLTPHGRAAFKAELDLGLEA